MTATIKVTGINPIELNKRKKALETINSLTTQELSNLVSMASSDKARSYLSNDQKFKRLKMFL